MKYLTPEEILILHARVVDATGGSHGVREIELLASIAHKPASSYAGKELYSGIFLKAAVLFEALVNYHVFVDGNKRTGLACAARVLYINGYEFTASNSAAEKTALAIATKKMSVAQLAQWLKENSAKIS